MNPSATGKTLLKQDMFPKGLHVLVVDDTPGCLDFLDYSLKNSGYEVTTTMSPQFAVDLLRKNKKAFDMVMIDAEMVEKTDFRLLDLMLLETDIPVIMMLLPTTGGGDNKKKMKGLEHGACHYLVKPPTLGEIQNMWQHVFKPRLKKDKSTLNPDQTKETEKCLKRKRDDNQTNSNEDEAARSYSFAHLFSNQKKPKFSWRDPEFHAKFSEAFTKLGDQAVPTNIQSEMNVPGLDCSQIASYLQKYRRNLEDERQESDNATASAGPSGHRQSSTAPSLLNLQNSNKIATSAGPSGLIRSYNFPSLLNPQNSYKITTSAGPSGHIRSSSFTSLLNQQIQNGKAYQLGTSPLMSHPSATPNTSNHSFLEPKQHFFQSTDQQNSSNLSPYLGIVNQDDQEIQVLGSTSSMFPDDVNIDLRARNYQCEEPPNGLPDSTIFDYFPMPENASSNNLNTMFQNDYTFDMTDHSTHSGHDEMGNMVAPALPSNMTESQGVHPLSFLNTDNSNYHLGSYSSADDDLSAAIRPFQRQ